MCNTGRVDGSDAGGSPGEGEGEGGDEGEGGGGQPAVAQDAGEAKGGRISESRLLKGAKREGKTRFSCLMCLQELKMTLGGRVKHLEEELAKSERAREELKEKREGEMVQVRYQLQSPNLNEKWRKPQL